MDKTTITICAAVWGASTGTISLIWNIIKELSSINIQFTTNSQIVGGSGLYDLNKNYFILTVINKGRRVIKIVSAGYYIIRSEKKEKCIIMTDSFAIKGERILKDESPTTDFLIEQNLIDLNNVDYLWARDARGKIYKKQIRTFPTFYKLYYKFKNNKK